MPETLTFPVLVGIAVPWLVALVTNDAMTSTKKRWITIFVTIGVGLLAALGVAMQYEVLNAEEIAKFIGVVFGVVSIIYAAFKDHGIDWLRAQTNKIVLPEPAPETAVIETVEKSTGSVVALKNEDTDTVVATVEEVGGILEVSVSPRADITPDEVLVYASDDLIPADEEEFYNEDAPSTGRHVAS